MALLEALVLFAVLLVVFYKWSTLKYGTFTERGVPHKPPKPLVGNMELRVVLGTKSVFLASIENHLYFKNSKVYGMYGMRDPMFVIKDIELIKKIGIKDFDYFQNHKVAEGLDEDFLLNKSLISLQDRKWKDMRNTLTPAFTGSKMRLMFELINERCIEGVNYLQDEIVDSGTAELELEMKDFFTRYANDVIASAAFGINVNSFKNKNNEFFSIGLKVTKFSGWALLKALLFSVMPKVMKAFRVKVIDQQILDYFEHLVLDAIHYRNQHKIVRPDMIQLLMEAKKHSQQSNSSDTAEHAQLNDQDMVAQCLLFFFAGFETVSQCLCFTAHELLEHVEIQQRLYEEVLELQQELAGQPLTYDALMKLPYMDMVVSESLRKWPPAVATDRVCAKDYTLKDENGDVVVNFKQKDQVFFNMIGMHYDPEHFENPFEFNPERFAEENKSSIKPFSYLPFGLGPRNCIGNRFALMEIKALLYHILLRFEILPAAKTTKDLMDSIKIFKQQPKDGFWMKFVKRSSKETA